MKRILDILGDLRIAFWLLLSVAAVMWIGSMYAAADYALFNSMNGVRVQDWFAAKGMAAIGSTWWIVALFGIFALLGINTAACTARRVIALWPKRSEMPAKRFAVLLSPSIIHLLFIGMLSGHLLSFTALTQERAPLVEGATLDLAGTGAFTVGAVRHRFFDEKSLLAGRIAQSTVEVSYMKDGVETTVPVEFLRSVSINGALLQLDMEKKKKSGKPIVQNPADENCNKENNYNYAKLLEETRPQLFIVATRDPGLFILIPGFALVILTMGWYFYQIGFGREEKE
ncbi:MAG: hypothetical protein MUC76_14855 [Spirochaetes bacterium]|nr:hypothetical protein [Spirochaetota bacterium]